MEPYGLQLKQLSNFDVFPALRHHAQIQRMLVVARAAVHRNAHTEHARVHRNAHTEHLAPSAIDAQLTHTHIQSRRIS